MTDRSGRTYEQYRELYWAEKKRRKALQSELARYIDGDASLRVRVKELETQKATAYSEVEIQCRKVAELTAVINKALLEQKP